MISHYFLHTILLLLLSSVTNGTLRTTTDKKRHSPGCEAKVLFVGNSHTNYNNGVTTHLMEFLKKERMPCSPIVERIAVDGYTLEDHLTDARTTAKLLEKNWDVVVLQENTGRAANEPHKSISCIQRIGLESESEAKIFLFMTWAYQDQPDMLQRIKTTYEESARRVNGTVVPVGLAFHTIFEDQQSTIDLYNADGIHPSMAGTFLAAAMFYSAIFDKDPTENPYTAGLPPETAGYLKSMARRVLKEYQK